MGAKNIIFKNMKTFEVTSRIGREPRLDDIRTEAAKVLRLRRNAVINVIDPSKSVQPLMNRADAVCRIAHRSIDARGEALMRYRIEAYYADEPFDEFALPEYRDVREAEKVIIIGAGPAGMFAALKLLSLGLKPVILERGKDVSLRKRDIARLSRSGELDEESNYCFGEGGAGTFSDGKLYTRSTKRGDVREVLHRLVEFGADRSILIDAHPHIGTDRLPRLVQGIRQKIEECGGEYHFQAKAADISRDEDGAFTVKTSGGEEFSAKAVILAAGHSATDIYELFASKGWTLEAKGMAMGVRVEHPQKLIDHIRYRGLEEPGFPPAEYSFAVQVGDRGVFSFCMCPGGVLVPSTTEKGTIVMNGMSNSRRNSPWANAGVVVQIEPEDLPEEYTGYGAFAMLRFQQDLERKIYAYSAAHAANKTSSPHTSTDNENALAGNPMAAPAQRMEDFCEGRLSSSLPESSYAPGLISARLDQILPPVIADKLKEAFPQVTKQGMKGYYTNEATLVAVESRTSSPVRISRDKETFQSPDLPGLFPAGEGAGYAGGIVSSAVDGINCALAVERYLRGNLRRV